MRADGVRTSGPVRDALRVAAAIGCFPVQALTVFDVVGHRVAAANEAAGCGPDGTCIDAGLFTATGTAELAVLAVEIAAGLLWWALPLFRRRRAPGVDEWWNLVALRLPRVFIGAGLLSLPVLIAFTQLR